MPQQMSHQAVQLMAPALHRGEKVRFCSAFSLFQLCCRKCASNCCSICGVDSCLSTFAFSRLHIQQDRAIKFAMAAQRVGDAIAAKML